MDFTLADTETLLRILHWRRDVRHFRTDPVPEDLLTTLAHAMETAPSVGNSRPWRVMRVNSPDLRQNVREVFLSCNRAAAMLYEGQQLEEYTKLKLSGLDQAPVQLAVFTDTNPPEGHGLGRQTMPQTLHQSTAMAIHAMWLVARAHNLGLGMVSILDAEAIASLLNAPKGWEFTAYLCIGWPEFQDDTPLLHRSGWQKNHPPAWQER